MESVKRGCKNCVDRIVQGVLRVYRMVCRAVCRGGSCRAQAQCPKKLCERRLGRCVEGCERIYVVYMAYGGLYRALCAPCAQSLYRIFPKVGRWYLRELRMPLLALQEEGLTK